jgi:hypothetical protein
VFAAVGQQLLGLLEHFFVYEWSVGRVVVSAAVRAGAIAVQLVDEYLEQQGAGDLTA